MTYKRECKVLPSKSYDWVTQQMFDDTLTRILANMNAAQLLGMPGFYELVSEEFNNEVLQELEDERFFGKEE